MPSLLEILLAECLRSHDLFHGVVAVHALPDSEHACGNPELCHLTAH